MHCPNCGAENEANARFCAECGTPLEDQPADSIPAADEDQTILSTGGLIAEEAKTVNVSQEDIAAAAETEEDAASSTVEPTSSASPSSSGPSMADSGENGGGIMNQRNIIIAIVVLIVLCCCCSSLAGIGVTFSDELDITRNLDLLPTHLLFA